MGISKYIGKKIHESLENHKAEKAYHKEQELNERNEYNRGRIEGSHKRGVLEGSGGVTAQEKFASRGGGTRSRGTQRLTGSGRGGFSGSMQNFDNIFGASQMGGGGGIGSGFAIGGGGEGRARPDRVITKANGRVKIEEYGTRHESGGGMGLGDGLGMGSGLGLDFGGSGAPSKREKKERHPYDIF